MSKKPNFYATGMAILANAIYRLIPYSPELRITNLEQLPRGTGARFLEVMTPHDGAGCDYIAVQWRHSLPQSAMGAGHHLIDFRPGK